MEDIDFMHRSEGGVQVYTTEAPFMSVIADTYEIGKTIIEKNRVWLAERILAKREAEMKAAMAEVIKLPDRREDSAPTEMNPEAEIDHYMNQGC